MIFMSFFCIFTKVNRVNINYTKRHLDKFAFSINIYWVMALTLSRYSKYSRTKKKTFFWFCKACTLGSCYLPSVNLLTRTLFQVKLFHLTHKNMKKYDLAEIWMTYLAGLNWTNYIAHTFYSTYILRISYTS